jgi:hypothetical protein
MSKTSGRKQSSASSAKDPVAQILERLPPRAAAGLDEGLRRDLARVVGHCGWFTREHRTGRFTEKMLKELPRRAPRVERQLKARLREFQRQADGIAGFLEKEADPELAWIRGDIVYPLPEGVRPVAKPERFRELAADVRAMLPGSAAQIRALCQEMLAESAKAAGKKAVEQQITLWLYDWFIARRHSKPEAEVRTGLIGNAFFDWRVQVFEKTTGTHSKGCETVRSRVRRRSILLPVHSPR